MRMDQLLIAGSMGLAVAPTGLAFGPLSSAFSRAGQSVLPWTSRTLPRHTRAFEAASNHNSHDYHTMQGKETSRLPGDGNPSDESGLEYWLDLRGVSMSPNEAIQFLNTLVETSASINEIQPTTIESIVTRILMDKTEFSDRVESESLDIGGTDSLLLYADDSITAYQEGLPQLDTFATVINAEPGRNLDAVLAMDAVLGHGRWVLVDGDPKVLFQDSAQWMSQQVSALYDLLITSYGSDKSDLGSLILPGPTSNRDFANGGMAVIAPTVPALVDLDFTLMQAALTRQMKASSDKSDLLLPTGAKPPALQTALVIPFDVDLWRVLLDLKQV